jgi:short subunit dehydrogenase-like uncharacterized protein
MPINPMAKKEFDLIVYGATGFTGRLVAEYLAQRKTPAGQWRAATRLNSQKCAT